MRTKRSLIPRRTAPSGGATLGPHPPPDEVARLAEAARHNRHGDRDARLIEVLFQTGLRISEALSITLGHLERFEGQPALRIVGKGKKPRLVACPRPLADSLQAYAYRR